jgi:acyl-CoA thioester hydrolase
VADKFTWLARVYYEDTDAGGIVFYANYLKFFERARTEWLRSGGIDQSVLTASLGIYFVVVHTAVDYHAPARLDDELELTVSVEKCGRASVHFFQQAWRRESPRAGTQAKDTSTRTESSLLASGHITIACVDRVTMRACPIPEAVLTVINLSLKNDAKQNSANKKPQHLDTADGTSAPRNVKHSTTDTLK